jgi:hypothetical protein
MADRVEDVLKQRRAFAADVALQEEISWEENKKQVGRTLELDPRQNGGLALRAPRPGPGLRAAARP